MRTKSTASGGQKSKETSPNRRSTIFNEPIDRELLSKVLASERGSTGNKTIRPPQTDYDNVPKTLFNQAYQKLQQAMKHRYLKQLDQEYKTYKDFYNNTYYLKNPQQQYLIPESQNLQQLLEKKKQMRKSQSNYHLLSYAMKLQNEKGEQNKTKKIEIKNNLVQVKYYKHDNQNELEQTKKPKRQTQTRPITARERHIEEIGNMIDEEWKVDTDRGYNQKIQNFFNDAELCKKSDKEVFIERTSSIQSGINSYATTNRQYLSTANMDIKKLKAFHKQLKDENVDIGKLKQIYNISLDLTDEILRKLSFNRLLVMYQIQQNQKQHENQSEANTQRSMFETAQLQYPNKNLLSYRNSIRSINATRKQSYQL